MESHDSLPYIDVDVSIDQRNAATLLVQRELVKNGSQSHPSIPELPASRLSAIVQQEVDRAGLGTPMIGGIDLARYDTFDEVSANSNAEVVKSALRTAYANVTYLRGRHVNLSLLEENGKNAWLIGNFHLEDIQNRMNADVSRTKEQVENINRSRKGAQEDVRGELLGLEETWKQGVGRIIETQLATNSLRT